MTFNSTDELVQAIAERTQREGTEWWITDQDQIRTASDGPYDTCPVCFAAGIEGDTPYLSWPFPVEEEEFRAISNPVISAADDPSHPLRKQLETACNLR